MADAVQSKKQILRRPAVEAKTGMPRSSLYASMKKGDFPAPIKLGARAVGWLESDVESWLASKVGA